MLVPLPHHPFPQNNPPEHALTLLINTNTSQGGGGLELKALKHRQTLGGGVGPGTAETFEKVTPF